MAGSIFDELTKIVGPDGISSDPEVVEGYSRDLSPTPPRKPLCVVWPRSVEEIRQVVKFANKTKLPLVPVSSGPPRFHGGAIPKLGGSIMVDLSRMKRILAIDRKNKVMMIEPGVTYGAIFSEAEKHGLRLLTPLLPRPSKSVLASCLEK